LLKAKVIKGTTLALALSGLITFATSPVYAVLGDQELKKGMDHPDVKLLQEELKKHGLFTEKETTTYFGDATEKSLRSFQISQNIEISGILDLTTFEALMALKTNSSGSKNETVVEELSPEVANKSSKLIFERALELENTGSDVKQLQEALKATGFLVIDDCTDYFGTQTESALKSFQESQGLKADGVAGLRTIDAINSVLAGRGIALPKPTRGEEVGNIAKNIIATGKKYIGVRYAYGGSSPKGFDCSGFTSYVFKQHGITLPRSTVDQAVVGTKVSKADLKAGDILIFSNTYKKGPSHAAIYIGNGQFIHSSSVGSGGVMISNLNSDYYAGHFSYGRRVLK
jgi:cell wall-associated NlpC family hydrolase